MQEIVLVMKRTGSLQHREPVRKEYFFQESPRTCFGVSFYNYSAADAGVTLKSEIVKVPAGRIELPSPLPS